MKEEEIIQAANEYVGHAEETEEDLSTYCNRKSFEAGAEWMKKRCYNWIRNVSNIQYSLGKTTLAEAFKQKMEE